MDFSSYLISLSSWATLADSSFKLLIVDFKEAMIFLSSCSSFRILQFIESLRVLMLELIFLTSWSYLRLTTEREFLMHLSSSLCYLSSWSNLALFASTSSLTFLIYSSRATLSSWWPSLMTLMSIDCWTFSSLSSLNSLSYSVLLTSIDSLIETISLVNLLFVSVMEALAQAS